MQLAQGKKIVIRAHIYCYLCLKFVSNPKWHLAAKQNWMPHGV